jgi:hypothetical protein
MFYTKADSGKPIQTSASSAREISFAVFFLIKATAVIPEKRKAMLSQPGFPGQIHKGRA